jgi:hypothetical protein
MLLGSDRDADSGGPAHDEKGTGHSRNAGAQASWPRAPGVPGVPGGWGSKPARPGHDHAEPGYAPPLHVPQCRLLAFPTVFYPRSLKSQ